MMLRERVKWALFPGMNLHARLRRRVLPRYFGAAAPAEDRLVLDAGCGNGMLAYESFRRGNRVLGISIKPDEAARCRRLFNGFLGIPEDRLSFKAVNLYDIEGLGLSFDEIVCSEVLEHVVRDTEVCRSFARMLKPGGVLHLCCPNAEHPDHVSKPLDLHESGGHVRPGYTMASYRALLDPLGLRIVDSLGLGGPVRQWCNRRLLRLLEARHPAVACALFAAALPLALLDGRRPAVPYSIYVRAVKEP